MSNFQCVLSHYCTSFHETIYKGTNTCETGVQKKLSKWEGSGAYKSKSLGIMVCCLKNIKITPKESHNTFNIRSGLSPIDIMLLFFITGVKA